MISRFLRWLQKREAERITDGLDKYLTREERENFVNSVMSAYDEQVGGGKEGPRDK